MELKDYTIEELQAEIKRRKVLKAEEMKTAKKCRNCKHCAPNLKVPSWCRGNYYICTARTWGRKILRNYSVQPSQNACDLFELEEK